MPRPAPSTSHIERPNPNEWSHGNNVYAEDSTPRLGPPNVPKPAKSAKPATPKVRKARRNPQDFDITDFNEFGVLAHDILRLGMLKSTIYLAPDKVIKAHRRRVQGKINTQSKTVEILCTIGAPNYQERRYIAKMQAMGKSFPQYEYKQAKQVKQ